jgi:uncharacterized membrane protein
MYSIPRPSASEAHKKSSRAIIQFPGLRRQRRIQKAQEQLFNSQAFGIRGANEIANNIFHSQAFGVRGANEKRMYSIPRPSASEAHTKSSRAIIQFPGLRRQRRIQKAQEQLFNSQAFGVRGANEIANHIFHSQAFGVRGAKKVEFKKINHFDI